MQDSQEIYSGKIVRLRIQTVPQPIGGTTRFEIVEHPDAVAIVAVRYEPADATGGRPYVALVKQPRPAINKDTWEIPAGLVKPQERDRQQVTAERELREETGYIASSWRKLSREYPSPGFSTEAITIYLATDLLRAEETPLAAADPAYAEISAIVWKPLEEALAMCASGEIDDGKTVLGLYLAQAALNESRVVPGGGTMYLDPTSPPNLQPAPPTVAASGGSPELNLENILLAEFNYASTTAYQAMEDRGRMFDRYLLIIGGLLVAGIGAIKQLNDIGLATYTHPVALLILAAGGGVSTAFFLSLVNLRLAWQRSAICMGLIKEFYVQRFGAETSKAFYWRISTLPKLERLTSVTGTSCLTVLFLNSLCWMLFAFLLVQAFLFQNSGSFAQLSFNPVLYGPAILVLLAALLLQMLYFRGKLRRGLAKAVEEARKTLAGQRPDMW